MEDPHRIREQEEVLSWCRTRYVQEDQEQELQQELQQEQEQEQEQRTEKIIFKRAMLYQQGPF